VKRLDSLVLRELIGPWIFGVSMFTMLLIAATYLGRIARYVVEGIPAETIVRITILLLPAILVQTFAMALLLGALLAFGRLSGDSEITAIRASGVSLYRIVAPVAVFSMAIAVLSFWMNENLVPAAARQSAAIMANIALNTDKRAAQPVSQFKVQDGRIVLMLGAVNFNPLDRTLQGVHVVFYDKEGNETWFMRVKELEFTGVSLQKWRIRGGGTLVNLKNYTEIQLGDTWPEDLPSFQASIDDLLAGQAFDPNIWSMAEIQERIRKGRADKSETPDRLRNFEFGYWNKIALPLAAFIFGTLGATLGIRNHRTGTSTGFAIAIAIIFSYFALTNFMNVFAMGGIFPPYVASFTPVAIGLVASGVIIWRRNR
jgi:lipopolysaccharide export system permease protein